jgi:hypothetical protein
MLTLKKIGSAIGYLPATIFSGMADLLFGYTEKHPNGKVVYDTTTKRPVEHDGILGLLMDGIKAIGRGISGFIADHKKAIAIAFWSSLLIGGAVGLTLFLWPAALAAVAGFTVYGLSIAGIVGTNALLQIGFAAGLAYAATSLFTYLTAGVINTIMLIKNYACPAPTNTDDQPPAPGAQDGTHKSFDETSSPRKMRDSLQSDEHKNTHSNENNNTASNEDRVHSNVLRTSQERRQLPGAPLEDHEDHNVSAMGL